MRRFIFFLFLFSFFLGGSAFYSFVLADTTALLRPTADGVEDSAGWSNGAATKCDKTSCFSSVNESSGSSCTTSDGDTTYIQSKTLNATQTFDIAESSIPDDSTITNIAITACHKIGEIDPSTFQTRYCVDGSCTSSGSNITTAGSYAETTQSHTVNFTKTSATDLEIGLVNTGSTMTRLSQISVVVTYTPSISIAATASVDTGWVKGGVTGKNLVFTVNNSSASTDPLQWVKITRPSAQYTLTAGSASGWSTAVQSDSIIFTGGSVSVGGSGTFTVTLDAAAADESQTAWTIVVDDDSAGGSTTNASAASSGALNTGIDATAPTSVGIASVNANSDTQLTANANTAADSASGVHASPYWFDETSGNSGATDSTSWQSGTSFVDTGLAASTQYCYRVKARDAVLNESAFSTEVCQSTNTSGVDTTAPDAVSNLVAGSPTGNSIRLTWTAPGDDGGSGTASSYDVRYLTSAITGANWSGATQVSGEPTPSIAGSSEAFTVGGLSLNTTYYFAMKTLDEAPNESGLSNVPSETTTGEADTTPPAISSISATNITANSAQIIWTTDELSSSQVEYGDSVSYGLQSPLDSSLTTTHSVAIGGLQSAVVYSYRVKSRDSAGNLAESANGTFLTHGVTGAPPSPPDTTSPKISDIKTVSTHENVTITWKTDEPTRSQLNYGKDITYGFKTDINLTLLTYHTVIIEKLEPETKYHFQIIDEDTNGNRAFSDDQLFTTQKIPPPPKPAPPPLPVAKLSEVSVVAVRPTSAKITWKTDVPATSQVAFGTSRDALTQFTIEYATLVEKHSITISDLSPDTEFFFIAVSRNALGEKTQSDAGSFRTESIEIQTVIQIAKPVALVPGSPGTQIPKIAAGETVTVVPILPTPGDTDLPELTLFTFSENPTENTSPTIRGRALDRRGVIASVAYSTDNGSSWHPITDISGIGSSVAQFSAKIPNLQDGNYPILFRARDNSGNVSKSETRVLVVDIKPPATGANIFFLGNQSLLPETFGTISTLTGLSHRLVISAVGGATSVFIAAEKKDVDTTHAAQDGLKDTKEGIKGIVGEIAVGSRGEEVTRFQELLVKEGVYDKEFVTGYFGNLTKEAVIRLQEKYASQIWGSEKPADLGGVIDVPTRRKINELFGVPSSDEIVFPLTYLKSSDLWTGDVVFEKAGDYELFVHATDGAGRTSKRSLNPFSVHVPGEIVDAKTDNPISGAKVTVFQFSEEANSFLLWPGEFYNQANPQITGENGTYRFLLPPGTYYTTVEKEGYRKFFTDILNFESHQTVNLKLPLLASPAIKLPVSIGGLTHISLPHLPDFFGMSRVDVVSKKGVTLPANVQALLGKEAPIFEFPTPIGDALDIRYLRGKKTILTTWATWSPLAQIQLPVLDSLQRERREREDDVRILLLAIQESPGLVETYLRRGGYEIQSVVDREGKLTELYPILTIPQHFFIDRKGILKDIYVGFLNKEALEEKLKML